MDMLEAAERIFPFWEHLSASERELLAASLRRKIFRPGNPRLAGAAESRGLLFVEAGQLRVYLVSPEGREVCLYRVFPGQFCVLSASCILEQITFDVFISADKQTNVISADVAAIAHLVQENLLVENFIYKQSAKRFSEVMWAMQQILFMRFDARLASFLISESSRTGSDTLRMTHEQISRQVGSAREVVSRMLGHFSEEGLVACFRGGLRIVNASGLTAVVHGASPLRHAALTDVHDNASLDEGATFPRS